MGPEGAINVIFRNEIAEANDPNKTRQQLVLDYKDKFANPYIAAEKGYLDDVIEPSETRPVLIRYLEAVKNKREARPTRKHGNIPL